MIAALESSGSTLPWETATARLMQEYEARTWHTRSLESGKGIHGPSIALNVNRRRPRGATSNSRHTFVQRKLKCWECGRHGHKAQNCAKRLRHRDSTSHRDEGETANHAVMLLASSKPSWESQLVLESGASDHMIEEELEKLLVAMR